MVFVFGIGCIVALIISIVGWFDNTKFDYPKIKFESFKKFYEINPNRWMCYYAIVECKIKHIADTEKFRFGYLDYLEYRSWLKQREEHNEQERHNRSTKRMMDVVKQDIAVSEAEAKRVQDKAFDDLMKWTAENKTDNNLDLQKLVEEYRKTYEELRKR